MNNFYCSNLIWYFFKTELNFGNLIISFKLTEINTKFINNSEFFLIKNKFIIN